MCCSGCWKHVSCGRVKRADFWGLVALGLGSGSGNLLALRPGGLFFSFFAPHLPPLQ